MKITKTENTGFGKIQKHDILIGLNEDILKDISLITKKDDPEEVIKIKFEFENTKAFTLDINEKDFYGVEIEDFDDLYFIQQLKAQLGCVEGGFNCLRKYIGSTLAWCTTLGAGDQEYWDLDEEGNKIIVDVEKKIYINFKSFEKDLVGSPTLGEAPNELKINDIVARATLAITAGEKKNVR